MSRWRREAARAIDAAIAEGKSKGLGGPALEDYVRAHGYPFGERAMHPYKVWCSVMGERFGRKKRGPKQADLDAWDALLAGIKAGIGGGS